MARRVTVVRDKGFDKLRASLVRANGARVRVGLYDDVPHAESNMSVAAIGTALEFGPQGWSFLRSTVDENSQKYNRRLAELKAEVMDGRRTAENALTTFGQEVVTDVRDKITEIREPGNQPSTIAAKGFDNPLIHTGFMRSKVEARVEVNRR